MLVGENIASFVMNAVKQALTDNQFEVEYSKLKVNQLSKLEEKPDFIILCADEDMHDNQDAIIYLKDYCTEAELQLCIVGYEEEIADLRKYIPQALIMDVFQRPLNTKDMIERLQDALEKEQLEEKKKHILVVDDSGTMLRTIKSWLEPKYKVSMASSGAMAISFLATNHPDLILLDYEMPICTGPQFMEMIRAEVSTSTIPVIFLTAKGDRESVEAVLSLKPAGYLLKTMKPEEVVKTIDEFFEKRKTGTVGF